MLRAGWILSCLLSLFLFIDGVMKLVRPAVGVETTVQLGYPESVILGLGIVLLACTALYVHCLDCKKASGGEAATFFAVPEDDFTLTSGQTKPFPYVANSGKKLERNFCPECGARVYTSNLEGFPGLIFVQLGSLDDPTGIEPKMEMFTRRRLPWVKPLDLPQFENMPS